MWLGDNMGSLVAWISFWPFFIVTVEKCLGPRGAQATSRAVQALYDEVVDEVIINTLSQVILAILYFMIAVLNFVTRPEKTIIH